MNNLFEVMLNNTKNLINLLQDQIIENDNLRNENLKLKKIIDSNDLTDNLTDNISDNLTDNISDNNENSNNATIKLLDSECKIDYSLIEQKYQTYTKLFHKKPNNKPNDINSNEYYIDFDNATFMLFLDILLYNNMSNIELLDLLITKLNANGIDENDIINLIYNAKWNGFKTKTKILDHDLLSVDNDSNLYVKNNSIKLSSNNYLINKPIKEYLDSFSKSFAQNIKYYHFEFDKCILHYWS